MTLFQWIKKRLKNTFFLNLILKSKCDIKNRCIIIIFLIVVQKYFEEEKR